MPVALASVTEPLPELPVSPYPNYVTARGLAQLQARLADAESRLAQLPADAALERDYLDRHIRWLQSRLGNAELVGLRMAALDEVGFGARVEFRDSQGELSRLRIVGEDEADPDHDLLSWVSPLARALHGAHVGDSVCWHKPDGDSELKVLAIDYRDSAPAH